MDNKIYFCEGKRCGKMLHNRLSWFRQRIEDTYTTTGIKAPDLTEESLKEAIKELQEEKIPETGTYTASNLRMPTNTELMEKTTKELESFTAVRSRYMDRKIGAEFAMQIMKETLDREEPENERWYHYLRRNKSDNAPEKRSKKTAKVFKDIKLKLQKMIKDRAKKAIERRFLDEGQDE